MGALGTWCNGNTRPLQGRYRGSTPLVSICVVPEVKVVATLVCGASNSGFESRQTPLSFLEDAANWMATGLENQGMAEVIGVRFLHLPLIKSKKSRCNVNVNMPGFFMFGKALNYVW